MATRQTPAKTTGTKTATATGKTKTAAAGSTTTLKQKKNVTEDPYDSQLEKLFVDMLKDTYWAEKHLVQALRTMEAAATTDTLQEAFADHRHVTEKHTSRLEKVFRMLGREPEGKKCDAMEGLTREATTMIGETNEGSMTRDAALIIAAQKIEHYEIATYGSLVALARTLDHEEAAGLLERTLWDEEETDQLLTDIAESEVNPLADNEPEDTDEDEEEGEEDASDV